MIKRLLNWIVRLDLIEPSKYAIERDERNRLQRELNQLKKITHNEIYLLGYQMEMGVLISEMIDALTVITDPAKARKISARMKLCQVKSDRWLRESPKLDDD